MTVKHKEALKKAYDVFCGMSMDDEFSDMDAAIRAYLDAMDAVIVPREPNDVELRDIATAARDFMTESGLYPRAKAMRKAMLAAAPNPFKEGEQ